MLSWILSNPGSAVGLVTFLLLFPSVVRGVAGFKKMLPKSPPARHQQKKIGATTNMPGPEGIGPWDFTIEPRRSPVTPTTPAATPARPTTGRGGGPAAGGQARGNTTAVSPPVNTEPIQPRTALIPNVIFYLVALAGLAFAVGNLFG